MQRKMDSFDFDTWKDLAERDPVAFERQRREYLHAEIELAPLEMRPRLHGLQWQIDMTRQRYAHPVVASAKLFEMMWDQVYGDNGFLDVLTGASQTTEEQPAESADVLPFRTPRSH